MKVAIVYHSGFGHTESLVPDLKKGMESCGVEVKVFKVSDLKEDLKELDGFDGMMFGSPTYMGDVSSAFKKFMEDSVKIWFVRGWKDRLAGGFTVSGSAAGDKENTINTMIGYAVGHGMLWCGVEELHSMYTDKHPIFGAETRNRSGFFKGLAVQADNAPAGADNPAKGEHQTAEHYGIRFAQQLKRLNK